MLYNSSLACCLLPTTELVNLRKAMSLIAYSGIRPLAYRIGTQWLQKSSNQKIFQIPNLQRLLSASSSSSASSSTLLKQNYENSHVSPTSGEQAPSPEPFVKNLFLGKFDKVSNILFLVNLFIYL